MTPPHDMTEGYVAIIKVRPEDDDVYFVMLSDDRRVVGWKTLDEGLQAFTRQYMDAHNRGGSWSASACINWMFFQPSIVKITKGADEIRTWVEDPTNTPVMSYSNVSGHFVGVQLDAKKAATLWEQGERPPLIVKSVVG